MSRSNLATQIYAYYGRLKKKETNLIEFTENDLSALQSYRAGSGRHFNGCINSDANEPVTAKVGEYFKQKNNLTPNEYQNQMTSRAGSSTLTRGNAVHKAMAHVLFKGFSFDNIPKQIKDQIEDVLCTKQVRAALLKIAEFCDANKLERYDAEVRVTNSMLHLVGCIDWMPCVSNSNNLLVIEIAYTDLPSTHAKQQKQQQSKLIRALGPFETLPDTAYAKKAMQVLTYARLAQHIIEDDFRASVRIAGAYVLNLYGNDCVCEIERVDDSASYIEAHNRFLCERAAHFSSISSTEPEKSYLEDLQKVYASKRKTTTASEQTSVASKRAKVVDLDQSDASIDRAILALPDLHSVPADAEWNILKNKNFTAEHVRKFQQHMFDNQRVPLDEAAIKALEKRQDEAAKGFLEKKLAQINDMITYVIVNREATYDKKEGGKLVQSVTIALEGAELMHEQALVRAIKAKKYRCTSHKAHQYSITWANLTNNRGK